MSRLQQEMVVKLEHMEQTAFVFLGKPIVMSARFCTARPNKYYKNKKKRLIKKWMKRYGSVTEARTDAVIYSQFILCHPSTLWRFETQNFIDAIGETIPEEEHDIHL